MRLPCLFHIGICHYPAYFYVMGKHCHLYIHFLLHQPVYPGSLFFFNFVFHGSWGLFGQYFSETYSKFTPRTLLLISTKFYTTSKDTAAWAFWMER